MDASQLICVACVRQVPDYKDKASAFIVFPTVEGTDC